LGASRRLGGSASRHCSVAPPCHQLNEAAFAPSGRADSDYGNSHGERREQRPPETWRQIAALPRPVDASSEGAVTCHREGSARYEASPPSAAIGNPLRHIRGEPIAPGINATIPLTLRRNHGRRNCPPMTEDPRSSILPSRTCGCSPASMPQLTDSREVLTSPATSSSRSQRPRRLPAGMTRVLASGAQLSL
jgi:hypothetical protein